jgi:hypothetical protein
MRPRELNQTGGNGTVRYTEERLSAQMQVGTSGEETPQARLGAKPHFVCSWHFSPSGFRGTAEVLRKRTLSDAKGGLDGTADRGC